MVKSSSNDCQEENEENKVTERSCCSRRGALSRHHKVSMILRLSTANENRSEREDTTSVVPGQNNCSVLKTHGKSSSSRGDVYLSQRELNERRSRRYEALSRRDRRSHDQLNDLQALQKQ